MEQTDNSKQPTSNQALFRWFHSGNSQENLLPTFDTSNTDDYEQKMVHYKNFLEERKNLIQATEKTSIEFAKTITTLSGVSLGFSLTILKGIPYEKLNDLTFVILYFTWGFFGISLIAITLSFLISEKALCRQIEINEINYKDLSNYKDQVDHKNQYSNSVDISKNVSLISFILGIIISVIFMIISVSDQRRSSMPTDKPTSVVSYC